MSKKALTYGGTAAGVGLSIWGLVELLKPSPAPSPPPPPPPGDVTAVVIWDAGVKPQFQPASLHDARVTITNIGDSALDLKAELLIGPEIVDAWNAGSLEPNEEYTHDIYAITVPRATGNYHVEVVLKDAMTGALLAEVFQETLTILSEDGEPPPPPPTLTFAQSLEVVLWGICGGYKLRPSAGALGIHCWTGSEAAGRSDWRIQQGVAFNHACAHEVALALGIPEFEDHFKWKGHVNTTDMFWIQYNLQIQLGAVRTQCSNPSLYLDCLSPISGPEDYINTMLAFGPDGMLWVVDVPCYEAAANECIAVKGADIQEKIDKLLAWMGTGSPISLGECCARKSQEYWDGLSDDMRNQWINAAWADCTTSLKPNTTLMMQYWLSFPISREDLLDFIRSNWGEQAVEDAEYALNNILEF